MKYAAVIDGFVRLKGPLFRALIATQDHNRQKYSIQLLQDCHAEVCEGFINIQIEARILWDDSGFSEICQSADAFFDAF
jgi:hypothetical protein